MSLLPYKSASWNTHAEISQAELDWPLDFEPTHFTVDRIFQGPRDTFADAALNTLDSVFNGAARSISVTDSGDLITFSAAHKLFTGVALTLAITTGLGGLSDGTYYAIVVSTTTIKLASSLANAAAGTAVAITSDGTGTLTFPSAYLAKKGAARDADGGQVRYLRTFATLPAQWSLGQCYNYTYPAVAAATVGTVRSFGTIAASGANFTLGSSITDDSFVTGSPVFVSVKFTRASRVYQWSGYTKLVAGFSGGTVVVGPIFAAFGTGAFSAVAGTLVRATTARTTLLSLTVGSRIVHDYALSSVASLDTDLPLTEAFAPTVTASAIATQYLTSATTPSNSEYATLITSGGELVAEVLGRNQYLGNIWCRRLRLVPAK